MLKYLIIKDNVIINTKRFSISYNLISYSLVITVNPLELHSSNDYKQYVSMLEMELLQIKEEKKIIDKIVIELIKLNNKEEIIEYLKKINAEI